MAELVTVYSIVAGALGLASKSATIVKDLRDLTSKYKNAELSLLSLVEECETIGLAWSRIQRWCNGWADEASVDHQLLDRLKRSVLAGNLVLSALEHDLSSLKDRKNTSRFLRRSHIVWNQSSLRDHQDRVRGQVNAMNLMLQVVMLPDVSERANLLLQKAQLLQTSDESAITIVPSRLSSQLDVSSVQSQESTDLSYKRLSFEDFLFTSKIYKRNYRHRAMSDQLRSKTEVSKPSEEVERGNVTIKDIPCHVDGISEQSSDGLCPISENSSIIHLHEKSLVLHEGVKDSEKSLTAQEVGDYWHLDLAISQGRLDILDGLLNQPDDDLQSWKDRTLLQACRSGTVPLIETLARRGANIGLSSVPETVTKSRKFAKRNINLLHSEVLESNSSSQSPLREAIRCNQLGAVHALLEHGAYHATATPVSGNELMHVAAAYGCADIIRLLRLNGASVTTPDSEGNLPVHVACKHGNVDGLAGLVAMKSQAIALNRKGQQPIHVTCVACPEGESLDIIETLITHGASIEAATVEGYRPLQFAIMNRKWSVVERLLALKATINIGGNIENVYRLGTPLSLALYMKNRNLASDLLSRGADTNAAGYGSGKTIIHFLAKDLNTVTIGILEELLNAGGDANAADKQGYRPLQYVALSQGSHRSQAAQVLLARGADVNAESSHQASPLYIATRKYDLSLVELLISHGAEKISAQEAIQIKMFMRLQCMTNDIGAISCLKLASHSSDYEALFQLPLPPDRGSTDQLRPTLSLTQIH